VDPKKGPDHKLDKSQLDKVDQKIKTYNTMKAEFREQERQEFEIGGQPVT
jgi:hypothetical protein